MQCTYFSRDGYCAKGQYCPFLHDKGAVRAVCKNYSSSTGCRFGSSCAFVHENCEEPRNITKKLPNTSLAENSSKIDSLSDGIIAVTPIPDSALRVPDSAFKSENSIDTVIEAATEIESRWKDGWQFLSKEDSSEKNANPRNNTSDWNFDSYDNESSSNTDGIYFYGASGTTTFDEVTVINNIKKDTVWDIRSRENASIMSSSSSSQAMSANASNGTVSDLNGEKVCPYFISGDCKYGSKCRYYHDAGTVNSIESSLSNPGDDNGKNDDALTECSICISTPDTSKGELYGVMSHCNCVFCLVCIREWRNEGTKDTFKSEQVRICPNCRVNSYFVVPSLRYVSGWKKEDLILRYKQSLSSTICKVTNFPHLLYFFQFKISLPLLHIPSTSLQFVLIFFIVCSTTFPLLFRYTHAHIFLHFSRSTSARAVRVRSVPLASISMCARTVASTSADLLSYLTRWE